MVKIRLTRAGRKNDPFYKIVALDSQKKRSARYLDLIGHWYPKKNSKKIDKELYKKWLKRGAQPTEAVLSLLK